MEALVGQLGSDVVEVVDGGVLVRVVWGGRFVPEFEAVVPVARVEEHEHSARAIAKRAAFRWRLVVK